jgi:hypothetical protein
MNSVKNTLLVNVYQSPESHTDRCKPYAKTIILNTA